MDERYYDYFIDGLPNFLVAIVVLLVGWLIARLIAAGINKALKKTNLDNQFAQKLGMDTKKYSIENIFSKLIFYLLMILVLVAVFNILNLQLIASPLVGMIAIILAAIPSILKAALILLIAWVIAAALRYAIRKFGNTLRVNKFLTKMNLSDKGTNSNTIVETLAKIAFYAVLLFALPAVLDALNLRGVSGPFSSMIDSVLAFLPKALAAALVLIVGWFVAKIIRDIVTNLLQALGIDKLIHRFGLSALFEGTTLSSVIGTIVFVLIMIPVTISALEYLDMRGITEPAIHMLNQVLMMIPNIAVAIVLVLIGIWLGKWLKQVVESIVRRIGFDSLLKNIGIGRSSTNMPAVSMSQLIGYIAQIIVVVLFVSQAFNVLGLEFFVSFASGIVAYIPHLLAALIILGVGMYIANLAHHVLSTIIGGPNKRVLASVAKYVIWALAIFMALDQLGVAKSIVNSAFILLLGGLALAFGLSFGLGGKDFAAKYLAKLDKNIESTTIQHHANTPSNNPSIKPNSTDIPNQDDGFNPNL